MKRQNKAAVVAISYLSAATIALGVSAWVWYGRAERAELAVRNGYQRAFNELVTAVEEVDASLQKSVYALSPSVAGTLCTEVFGKAMTAQMSLAALPFASRELEQTSDFITKVGDYAFALSRNAAGGQGLTGEETENLRRLSDDAAILALNLKGLQTELLEGRLSLTELRQGSDFLRGGGGNAPFAGDSIRLIEQEFPEVPTLIYDGPFSQHLNGTAPKALEGLPQIDDGEAKEIAARFLGLGRGEIQPQGACEGELPCWRFAAEREDGSVDYISVTKQGGQVLSLLSSRIVGAAVIPVEQAVKTAKQFLGQKGYDSSAMAETYHMIQNGVLTINFAYREGEVLCYPDLVKVSVALDTGRVCGFEAGGYLNSHRQRNLHLSPVAVGEEEARRMIPDSLRELAHQLALIPSPGKTETLCHEFKCAAPDGRHYIIYVNAQTGAQEKILILLEDASGALTL